MIRLLKAKSLNNILNLKNENVIEKNKIYYLTECANGYDFKVFLNSELDTFVIKRPLTLMNVNYYNFVLKHFEILEEIKMSNKKELNKYLKLKI